MPLVELPLSSCPVDTPTRVEHEGSGVVLVRRSDDRVHGYIDVCPHARWMLSDGEVVDGQLECAGHAYRFDLVSGRCADVPALHLTPVNVTVNGDTIIVQW